MSAITVQQIQAHLYPEKRQDTSVYAVLGRFFLRPAERITCKDGFNLSVQASEFTYCTPRDNFGPWSAVEVGFPSKREALLMPYAEDRRIPTATVYGYVPIETVAEVIEKHGGMEEE